MAPLVALAALVAAKPALGQDPTCALSDGTRIWSAERHVADKGGLASDLLYVPHSDTLFIHHTKGYAAVSEVSTAGWAGAIGYTLWGYDLYHCGDCPHSVLTMTVTADATRGYVQGNCCSIGYWFFDESGQGVLSADHIGAATAWVIDSATIAQTPTRDLAFLNVPSVASSEVLDVTSPVGAYAGQDTPTAPVVATFGDVDTWVVGSDYALGFDFETAKLVSVALSDPDARVAERTLPEPVSAWLRWTQQQSGAPVQVLQKGAVAPAELGPILLAWVDSAGQIAVTELEQANGRSVRLAQRSGDQLMVSTSNVSDWSFQVTLWNVADPASPWKRGALPQAFVDRIDRASVPLVHPTNDGLLFVVGKQQAAPTTFSPDGLGPSETECIESNWDVDLCGCITPSCTEPIGDGMLYRFNLACTGAPPDGPDAGVGGAGASGSGGAGVGGSASGASPTGAGGAGAESSAGGDAASPSSEESGCGCVIPGGSRSSTMAGGAALALLAAARCRPRPRRRAGARYLARPQ